MAEHQVVPKASGLAQVNKERVCGLRIWRGSHGLHDEASESGHVSKGGESCGIKITYHKQYLRRSSNKII